MSGPPAGGGTVPGRRGRMRHPRRIALVAAIAIAVVASSRAGAAERASDRRAAEKPAGSRVTQPFAPPPGTRPGWSPARPAAPVVPSRPATPAPPPAATLAPSAPPPVAVHPTPHPAPHPARPPFRGAVRPPRRSAARAHPRAVPRAPAAPAVSSEGPDSAPVTIIDDAPYVGVNGLARLLDATKFWRADVRKLTLRSGRNTITFTVDDPFVVVNDSTRWLPNPVRSVRGELQIPVALIASLPADSTRARLGVDTRHARLVLLPASGGVGSPSLTVSAGVTRLEFPADQPDQAAIVARSRAHLRLRFGGLFTGALPESLPQTGLLRDARPIASAAGSAFEFEVAQEAQAFRLVPDLARGRVVLELLREPGAGSEAFAPEGPPGPRALRVIVLDPGHGGTDPGVMAGGAVEKDLALALASMLRTELEHRLPARVVLTRNDDREITADQRAEIANQARADLVLSLHFDGLPGPRARGATAYCPPSTFVAAEAGARPAGGETVPTPQAVVPVPWRDVALRHAVPSRSLADAILSALELRGLGPTRLRERLPSTLLGVNAPGLLLECATLTSPADRERVTQPAGLRDLAAAIADGVVAWQRNE